MLKKLLWILFSVILIFAIGLIALIFWFKSGNLSTTLIKQVSQPTTGSTVIDQTIFKDFLGIDESRNYLLLFLNNTELRPGGGFIGAYAVVQMDNSIPSVLKVEGTEILDNYAPRDFVSIPPKPLKDYLDTNRLEFRDSNWSPDFVSSSIKSLELYKKENGLLADKIDGVIGFTPTVIEEILKITGPITHKGITFDSSNFTEKLEYEVEYGYKEKGIDFKDRKQIMGEITKSLIKKLGLDILLNWSKYYDLTQKMIAQKHIMVYSPDSVKQKFLIHQKIDGQVKQTENDYLLWVDANLGALKTDASIKRELSYSFEPNTQGKYNATVKMKYLHQGVFDWRTSRYRTYARIYVPVGSKFVSVNGSMLKDRNVLPGKVDQGIENNKQWFGTFIAIEPGQSKELTWTYEISPQIAQQIKNNQYKLLVQKQLGSINNKLTLKLNFGKDIVFASPGEPKSKHGDKQYDYTTDLLIDREFEIKTTSSE